MMTEYKCHSRESGNLDTAYTLILDSHFHGNDTGLTD